MLLLFTNVLQALIIGRYKSNPYARIDTTFPTYALFILLPSTPKTIPNIKVHIWYSFGVLFFSLVKKASGSTFLIITFTSSIEKLSSDSNDTLDVEKFTTALLICGCLFNICSISLAQFAQSKLFILYLYLRIIFATFS